MKDFDIADFMEEPRPYRVVEGREDAPFAKFFQLAKTPGAEPPCALSAQYVDYLNAVVRTLRASDMKARIGPRRTDQGPYETEIPADAYLARDALCDELGEAARRFIGGAPVLDCMKETALLIGGFHQRLDDLSDRNQIVVVWRSDWDGADHIDFRVQPGALSPLKRRILGEIERAISTVVFSIFADKQPSVRKPDAEGTVQTPHSTEARRTRAAGRRSASRHQNATTRWNYYVRKLVAVARNGLIDPEYGLVLLEAFKDEFAAREAALFKTRYLKYLATLAFPLAGALALAYALIAERGGRDDYAAFLALTAGGSAGVWFSFAIRPVDLTFSDFALLEEDRLNPLWRLLFGIGASLLAGIAIRLFSIDLGPYAGLKVLAIGLFCGTAERGFKNLVARPAADRDWARSGFGMTAPNTARRLSDNSGE